MTQTRAAIALSHRTEPTRGEVMGALLWMGIYDRHTLDGYAKLGRRVPPGAPIKRLDETAPVHP